MEKDGYKDMEWSLKPDNFSFPDYLEFQKALAENIKRFKEMGICEEELREAWEKCGVRQVSFVEWRPGRKNSEIDKSDDVYWIEMRRMGPAEIKAAIKELPEVYPEAYGIKINPKEFYKVLFYYEMSHTVARSGRHLFEFVHIRDLSDEFWKPGEMRRFEQKAWRWAVKMARGKNPKIKVLYRSADEEKRMKRDRYRVVADREYKRELAARAVVEARKKVA